MPNLPEGGKKWVEFDPTGLERAAKAVKELDNSCELMISCMYYGDAIMMYHREAIL